MMTEAEKFIAWRNKRLEETRKTASPTRTARPHRRCASARKSTRLFAFGDEMLPISEIADRLGTSKAAVYYRIKVGIPLNVPFLSKATNEERQLAGLKCKRIGKRHLINGEMLSVAEIAERTGLGENTIYRRIRAGVALDMADTRRKKELKSPAEFDIEMLSEDEDPLSREDIEDLLECRLDGCDFKYS